VSAETQIGNFFKGTIFENESLSKHTWYQIGGPCDHYCIPKDVDDLKRIIDHCEKNKQPYFIHGKGSNLLISDSGIRGFVIDLSHACSFVKTDDTRLTVGAGFYMPKLVLECEKTGLGGIEMFAGIPGTVGGAIKMNAGCHGKEIFDVLTEVTILQHGQICSLPKEQIEFGYRHVKNFDDPAVVILSGTMQLERTDIKGLTERRKQFMKKRQQTQPINLPSSGSVFKNPKNDHAARMIDQCGLKGFKIGHASVSTKHANFIVNEGGAKASDVLQIMKHVKHSVFERFGISMELEVKLIGFSQNELNNLI
jgi:UDP-N-acetylmuramate dehydrogenase